jgi:hypothetical protein
MTTLINANTQTFLRQTIMKKKSLLSLSLLVLLALVLLNCDKKKDEPAPGGTTPPTMVSTAPALDNAATATTPSDITAETAKVSSTLTGNGGAAITQHGHVWSDTKAEPTTADAKTELGKTDGPFPLKFTSDLKSLKANTTYNVRAYATNDKGTSYGTAVQVKTAATPNTATTFKSVTWSVHSTSFPKGGIYDPAALYLNGKIYTLGGKTPETKLNQYATLDPVDDFWEYDIASKKWTQLPKMPFMFENLMGHYLSYTYKNKIFAGNKYVGIYEYDLTTKQWLQKVKPMNSIELPWCRMILDDKLYSFSTFAGTTSKVMDLNTFEIKDIPSFQTEAGSWVPQQATFMWNNRIHFWIKQKGQTDASTKFYTIAFDPKTNTYENLGTMTNLIPQAAAGLEPKIAFEKNGFIYAFGTPYSNPFLYNPTLKIMGGLAFNGKPNLGDVSWFYSTTVSDGQGNMYQVLGEAPARIGFQLPLNDPNRYDKSVYHIQFQ